jgi:hypothetical protein
MRWKLLRRRLSVSAPRMIVRSHLPWPCAGRWWRRARASPAALALWAFEFGKEIAGLDRDAKEELATCGSRSSQLREERDQARPSPTPPTSLLKAERTRRTVWRSRCARLGSGQARAAVRPRVLRALLPTGDRGAAGPRPAGRAAAPGQLRYQMLLMQNGKAAWSSRGATSSTVRPLDGKPWTRRPPGGPQPFRFKQYKARRSGRPPACRAVIKTVQARITRQPGRHARHQTTRSSRARLEETEHVRHGQARSQPPIRT